MVQGHVLQQHVFVQILLKLMEMRTALYGSNTASDTFVDRMTENVSAPCDPACVCCHRMDRMIAFSVLD